MALTCAAPAPDAGRYRGPRITLPPSALQDHWRHVACTWSGQGTLPAVFIDGKRIAGSVTLLKPTAPWPRDLFVGYAGGSPQGKVVEQAEIRLSSVVRYTADFTPAPFGARFEPDGSTCGIWHLGEGGGTMFFDAGLRWPLVASHGAQAGPASDP